MDRLKMHSVNIVDENIEKIGKLFPNCITEVKRENGEVERAVDFDMLKQELTSVFVEGVEERYQFTWPDKKKSVLLANAPVSETLRPCREESVDFDNTENLYIEGDNLDVLKLLQETYLDKIKMIYIDPPYNTGNDFVYEDDFAESAGEYLNHSGQFDTAGNKLVQNAESNGRFHTDWLNMMYPRLKLAKSLLADNGAIFIHIDEHEVNTLSMVCKEIFGQNNELGTIIWDKRNPKGVVAGVAYQHESILVYCKNLSVFASESFTKKKEHAKAMLEKVAYLINEYGTVNDIIREEYKSWLKNNRGIFTKGELAYSLIDDNGDIYRTVSMAAPDKPETRSHRPLIHPVTKKPCAVSAKGWRFTDETMDELLKKGRVVFGTDETTVPNQKYYLKENMEESVSSLLYYGGSDDALGLPFDNPKPVYVVKKMIDTICKTDDDIILDFFSGSATVAQAVFELNNEDKHKRKFILVQLPEEITDNNVARASGFQTIADIGKERIKRASKKIVTESTEDSILDCGFRVLKLDSSNMKQTYYSPSEYSATMLNSLADNIKEDRTPEDLLFQVMLDLGVFLSSKIETTEINGKKVFNVANGFVMACFDYDITNETITEIAKKKPYYFVMRDSSMEDDSVATNFEQIFMAYSPDTVRKVL